MQLLDGEYYLARGRQSAILNATLELVYPKHSSFTGILESSKAEPPSIGQIQIENESSRMIFIYPGEKNIVQDLCTLVEGLGVRAGALGAHFMLAAVDESSPLHYALRQCCYHPLFSQKYWKINLGGNFKTAPEHRWRSAGSQDLISIQSFLRACLPPLVQTIWRLNPQNYPDFLLYTKSGLCGITSIHRYGDSAFVYPLLLPGYEHPEQALAVLIHMIAARNSYLLIPSFQNFLERTQTCLKAVTVLKQSLLVKYFVIHQKATIAVEESLLIQERIRKPNPPLAPTERRDKN